MYTSIARVTKRIYIIGTLIAMLSIIAHGAEKISQSSGQGIDPVRWSVNAGTGTITSDGTVRVTGTGTEFLTQLFGFPAGSMLFIDGVMIGTISSIVDNATLQLDAPPVGGTFTGRAFTHRTVPMPGDNVTIAAGHGITISGWRGLTVNDLTIKGTGSLRTDCNLFNITGNVVIDGEFIQEPGCRIIMDGTASTIGGSVWPVVMRSLRVKTTVLPAVVILHAPLVVSERLDIEDGTIDLNSQSLTIGTGAASPGALLSHAAKYQNISSPGQMTRWFAPGTTSMTDTNSAFPLANGNSNRSMWLAGRVTGGGTVTVNFSEVVGTSPITITDNLQVFTTRTNSFWSISCGAGFAGADLQLRLQACGLPGVRAVDDLTMSGSTSAIAGTFLPSTLGTAPSDYQVNRLLADQVSLPGSYYIAVTADSPLPVELRSFSATVRDKAIVLQWHTTTETNNYGFEIERRSMASAAARPSEAWTTLGFVEGSGTTNSGRDYRYADNHVNGSFSYRLKQIDRDGKFVYSAEVNGSVMAPATLALLQNYPNPFNPSTRITFTVPAGGHAALTIFNMIGQKIVSLFDGEAEADRSNQVEFTATGLPTGIYFARLEYAGKSQLMKMQLIK